MVNCRNLTSKIKLNSENAADIMSKNVNEINEIRKSIGYSNTISLNEISKCWNESVKLNQSSNHEDYFVEPVEVQITRAKPKHVRLALHAFLVSVSFFFLAFVTYLKSKFFHHI